MTLLKERLQPFFPELGESEDELTWLTKFIEEEAYSLSMDIRDNEDRIKLKNLQKSLAWLEKQGISVKECLNLPHFTFDDVLALQCCMETVKKVQEDKELYEQLQNLHNRLHDAYWLEKQGEQILANSAKTCKNEPKFKNGQWIVWQDKYYKVNDNGCGYELIDQNGLKTSLEYSTVDENAHIFTTQDAKPGDVLYSLDSKQPFIFKHRKPNEQAAVYCGINTYGKFFIGNTKDCVITTDKYIPADKFQRDLLFKKIEEAGYQWDVEKLA